MPLLSKRPAGEGFLAVWHRDESTEQLLGQLVLSPAEQSYYEKIAHQARRRKEWLIWHLMVREFLGAEAYTGYDQQGQPLLMGYPGEISVSHSNDLVVLYYQPERCGVDIEDCGRRFDRVSTRYISPDEWLLSGASDNNRFQALAWCVKETVYKYARKPGLDFRRDMRIEQIDTNLSEVYVRLLEREVRLKFEFLQGHCLAYTVPGK